ncbi:LamG-like jellyroll fold domain-containing protein [Aeoliella mucimassa]|uniref:CotH protein n=1 Tax=Aeoliella mucimassa TaxID=2527972 RepID=A0A518AIV1_9BACT|nr:LamG-like jellyroll fold domain-containing protein [Aeoliella mucimassa]QDU54665.1 CotH protein [Aeoliella mucimassa]
MLGDKSGNRSRRLRLQRLEDRCLLDAAGLRITEIMASNDNTLEDYQGDSADWLELYNPTTSTIDLQGLYLTDDASEPTKWQFPAGYAIEPGEFQLVFASDKDTVAPNGELHTNFKLSADGEYLGLIDIDGVTVIDAFAPEFPPQVEDISYGLEMSSNSLTLIAEGDTARAWQPTSAAYDASWTDLAFDDSTFDIAGPSGFGFESGTGAPTFVGQYSTEVPAGTTSLYVRVPFTVESLEGITQLTMNLKYDDGFVAYLNGVEVASVNAPASRAWNSTATSIHDDYDAIVFEEFDLTSALGALEEGDNVLAIHALNRSATSSDFLIVPELITGGAQIGNLTGVGYFDTPTPGYGNGATFAGFATEPTFSVPHGFYDSTQWVEITSETTGATIVYTTDGSTPTVDDNLQITNGQLYTGAVRVNSTTTLRAIAAKQDFKASFVQAASYLFLDDIVDQSPTGQAPAGWTPGDINGQLLDYGIDPQIIAQYGEQAVKDSLTSIPTITLTTDLANLFDSQTGIYVNALNRGREWERATSVELVNPDGTEGFSTNAGLRIRGGYNRNDFNPKHGLRLYFRSEYGDGLLNYPLFGEEGVDKYDVIDLRTAQNYSWAAWGDSVNGLQNTYLREVFARDTQADMEQPYTRSRYYHLYLNGHYWGLYMTQERVQEHYAETYFGGDEEDYDVVKADSTEEYTTEIADGNDVAWRQLFEQAQALADSPTTNADNYWAMQGLNTDGTRNEGLEVLLDVDNLIDYMMIIIYTGGHDTGISAFLGNDRANNWFGVRDRETGDQGFQFFLHDNEHSLGSGELTWSLHGTYTIDRTGPFLTPLDDNYDFFNPVYLHQDLLAHPAYKQAFIDRVQTLMFGDGVLTPEANIARMNERVAQVETAIIAESARWGDTKRSNPYDVGDWRNEVNWLLDTYFPTRHAMVLEQLEQDGLYREALTFSLADGEVPYASVVTLNSDSPRGTIYYTTDGVTDPRQFNGDLDPSAKSLVRGGSLVLTDDTTFLARIRNYDGEWSGLVDASYVIDAIAGDFNGDQVVDPLDYELWRTTYGSTTDLRADGNHNQVVDLGDYTIWRDNLGDYLTITTPAAATPSTVTGTSTQLMVDASSSSSEANLIYTWNVSGPGQVTFDTNGNNAAQQTTATFTQAGEYLFTVIIEDTSSDSLRTSEVQVTVDQVASGISIATDVAFVAAGTTQQLSVVEVDQFGQAIAESTGAVWSITAGDGQIDQSGLLTAPAIAGTTTVRVETTAGSDEATLDIVAPTAWYEANSNSGTTLIDSAQGNHGEIEGPADWQTGVSGNALALTGGRAELPTGIVSGLHDTTIATWFYLDSIGTWSRIFDFGSGTGVNMFLTPRASNNSGPLRFAIKTNSSGTEQQLDGPSLSAGQWYHVAITLTGSTGTMYLDGVPVAVNNNLTLTPGDMGVTTENYLGDSQYASDPSLQGRIDDFRIYAYALPAEQIQGIVQASVASLTAPPVVAALSASVADNTSVDESTDDTSTEPQIESAFALLAEDSDSSIRPAVAVASQAESQSTDDAWLLLLAVDRKASAKQLDLQTTPSRTTRASELQAVDSMFADAWRQGLKPHQLSGELISSAISSRTPSTRGATNR